MRDIDAALVPCPCRFPLPRHAVEARVFQGIPGMEVTRTGRLWATWYSGGATEGPENFVVLATSTDSGKSWEEVRVIDPPGQVRAFDPGVWIDPLGRLWWFYSQCYSRHDGNINDGRCGVWVMVSSDAESADFGSPRRIAHGVMMNKPTVLSDGAGFSPRPSGRTWADATPCPN